MDNFWDYGTILDEFVLYLLQLNKAHTLMLVAPCADHQQAHYKLGNPLRRNTVSQTVLRHRRQSGSLILSRKHVCRGKK